MSDHPDCPPTLGREGACDTDGDTVLASEPGPPGRGQTVPLDASDASSGDETCAGGARLDVSAALALLQVAGQVLWEGRDAERRLLLRSVYDGMGGVAGALASHADRVLQGLSKDQIEVARQVLLRLVTPQGTRRVLDAIGGDPATLRINDPEKRALRWEATSLAARVQRVAWTPAGDRLFGAGDDGVVRAWDRDGAGGEVVASPCERVIAMTVADAGTLVLGCAGGTLRVWDIEAGRSRYQVHAHDAEVNDVPVSPGGGEVASVSDDGRVRLWSLSSGEAKWVTRAVLRDPVRVWTHRGWWSPASGAKPEKAGWSRFVREETIEARGSADGRVLCARSHAGALVLWDLKADRETSRRPIDGPWRLAAGADACVALASEGPSLVLRPDGTEHALGTEVEATAVAGDRLLVAREGAVIEVGGDGSEQMLARAEPGVTALARRGTTAILGRPQGAIELVDLDGGSRRLELEDLPASAVTSMALGPRDTVAAGFAKGELGLWSVETGVRLLGAGLHGSVDDVVVERDVLSAVSSLGDRAGIDLGALSQPACELLREVWQRVPVVWEAGHAAVRDAPAAHPCAGSAGR